MTQPPIRPSALRGAVDLSGLGQSAPSPAGAPGSPTAPDALLVDGTDANFQQLLLGTRDVAALAVLWSSSHPETERAVETAVAVAGQTDGRLRVIAIDVQTAPGVAAAFQVQQVPMTVGLVAGQPVPLFAGLQPAEQLRQVVQELLKVAAQNGVTGRVQVGEEDAQTLPEVPEYVDAAFEAIERGDLAGAAKAYEQALQDNPTDSNAASGLAQVRLLERTSTANATAARAAAAAEPSYLDAQLLVADFDVVGGHVEDAFSRLIDLVRRTADPERTTVRQRLLELFDVVGGHDPRVAKARRDLMSALF